MLTRCYCIQKQQGVCHHIVALSFTFKGILRQKKNYENSNVSPMQKYNLQKILQKKSKSFKILSLYNSKYRLSKILI
jgi:hypothetical protein